MPANPEHIHAALREISRGIEGQSRRLRNAQQQALVELRRLSSAPDGLRRAAEAVLGTHDPNLRCALPVDEKMGQGYSVAAAGRTPVLIAVDGSQAVPDRHAEVLFGLLNIGCVTMHTDSGVAPEVDVDSRMLFGEGLYPDDGPLLTEGDIALLRDAAERSSLLRHASASSAAGIALTDGPLELWGSKDVADSGTFERALSEYLSNLQEFERLDWTVAGYVDKPGADLVIRLLEIANAEPGEFKTLRSHRPLRGATDRWLFSQILEPGQRSAILALQSRSSARYAGSLAIHFFYLNVGERGRPVIARVELPKWVVADSRKTDDLQSALLAQSRMLGNRPYPYILHRAHETARISQDEKEQIKLKILLELRNGGVEPEGVSGKSSAKTMSAIKGSF